MTLLRVALRARLRSNAAGCVVGADLECQGSLESLIPCWASLGSGSESVTWAGDANTQPLPVKSYAHLPVVPPEFCFAVTEWCYGESCVRPKELRLK